MTAKARAFPGNDWLAGKLGSAVSAPRVHGFFRGAHAGPLSIGFEEALDALWGESPAPARGPGLRDGLASLWEETGLAYHRGGVFPSAIPAAAGGDRGNRMLAEGIVDFAEGFLEGYELAGGAAGGPEGDGRIAPEVEDLLDDLDLLLRSVDELDEEIGKEGIVAAQSRLLYEGLARLEKDMREVARRGRERLPREADPSAARKGARKKRRGVE